MHRIKSSADISAHLGAAEALSPGSIGAAQKVVGSLMAKWPNDRGIYLQLQRLADFITKTRQELSSLRPTEVKQEFISRATDELDAIVEGTASATHRIMDAADVIMEVAGRMQKEDADKAMGAVNAIYEACTFQDITGQRVTKVVTMLKVIESRVDAMVLALGEMEPMEGADAAAAEGSLAGTDASGGQPADAAAPPQGSKLDGPALPGRGKSQDDIDRILSGEA